MVFGRWLGYESGAFMCGISALIKETAQTFLTPSATWDYSEKSAICNLEEGFHQNLILDFQLPELWEINLDYKYFKMWKWLWN